MKLLKTSMILALWTAGASCRLADSSCSDHDVTCNPWLLFLRGRAVPCQRGQGLPGSSYAFLGSPAGTDNARSICATTDGGLVVAGEANANLATLQGRTPINPYAGNNDLLVVKLTAWGSVDWYTFLGSAAGNDTGGALTQASDGGFIVSGSASANIPTLAGRMPLNSHAGNFDFLVVKLTSSGSVDWFTFLGGTGSDTAYALIPTSDDGFLIAGDTATNFSTLEGKAPLTGYAGGNDFLTVKLTSSGRVDWYTFLGGAGFDAATNVAQTSDGGFAIVGSANANIPALQGRAPLNSYTGLDDFLVVKLTSVGMVDWHTFVGSVTGTDFARAITQASDGGLIIAGISDANISPLQGKTPLNAYTGLDDVLLVKLTATGMVDWHTFLGSAAGNDFATALTRTSDGEVVITGSAGSNIPSLQGKTPINPYAASVEFFIVKATAAGLVNWYTFLGGAGSDNSFAITQTSDAGLLIAGGSSSNISSFQGQPPLNPYTGIDDFLIVKLKPDGTF